MNGYSQAFTVDSENAAKALFFRMLRIRNIEEAIAERYSEGKMRCPTHLSIGQESVAAAAGLALNFDDFAVSTHRAHGHYLGKGGDLKAMLAELYGKQTGSSHGKGGSMHLSDENVGFVGSTAIVGNSIPLGVGLGLSIKLKKRSQISCVFLGDGATEEGAFYEALNFSVVKQLPVLFICENNLYSVYSSLAVRQPQGRKIHEMVKGMGVANSYFGDGNDVLECYRMISEAVQNIRQNNKPWFIEFLTYRWREHCGPNYDNDIGYRSQEEFLAWQEKDPIKHLMFDLKRKQLLTESELSEMQAKIDAELAEAFLYAEQTPFPESSAALIGEYR